MATRSRKTGRSTSWSSRIARWNARAFQPRQIILRSDDRIHALKLSQRLQQFAAGTALLTLTWTAVSIGALYYQSGEIEGKRAQLARAEKAYGDLLADVQRARSEVIALAATVQGQAPVEGVNDKLNAAASAAAAKDGQTASAADTEELEPAGASARGLPLAIGRLQAALDSLAERNGKLSDKLIDVQQELERSRGRTAALTAERVRVERALEQTQQALSDAKLNRTDLHDRVSQLRSELKLAQVKRQASQQDRLDAESRIAELEERLAVARESEQELENKVAGLEQELTESEKAREQLVAERENLSGKVGRLERALGEGTTMSGSLGERIAGLEKALMAAEKRGDALAAERDQLRQHVASLKTTVEQLEARQSGLVERASARTLYSLEAVEKTIAMTGLDVDAVASRVRSARSGTGGPFIEASFTPASVEVQVAEVERLDRQMQRLVALQTALGSMPLTAPVDSFWTSSHFGKRKDPYNGRWAMHEGVDLAATAGSPVHATAPGTVVFAGQKSGYGRMVEVDHGFGIRTRYAHLRSIQAKRGDRVAHRQTIGALGSSGRSTGPHVHYEVLVEGEPVDPSNFLKAGKYVFKG